MSERLSGLVGLGAWVDPLAAQLAAAALNPNGIVVTVQSDPFNTSYGGGRMHRPGPDPILEVPVRAEDEAEARRVLAATDDALPPESGDRAILDWSKGIDERRAQRDGDVQRIVNVVALVLLISVVLVLVGAAIASAA